jgi:hypothetical protein
MWNETGSVVCGEFGQPEIKEETSGAMVVRTTMFPIHPRPMRRQ